MVINKKVLKNLILLFICLFSFIKAQDSIIIDYNYSTYTANRIEDRGAQKQNYIVDFSNGDITTIPFYLKVEVISNDNSPAPLLFISNSDKQCNLRNHLVKNTNDKAAFMWIKREEINVEAKELYIHIECEKDNCNYEIYIEGKEIPIFEPNFVYSYLVNTYNKNMEFQIQGNETNVYMTVALEGSSKAILNVDGLNQKGIKFRTGSVITFFIEEIKDESNIAKIIINGTEVGDYLTLSVHLVNNTVPYEGLAPNEFLLPNGPEITGYLEKNIMNEECFPLDLSNDKYKNIKEFYITGRIHTKYAWFFLENEYREFLEETDVEILDGQLAFKMTNNYTMNYICFELPGDITFTQYKMAFSFSLNEFNSLNTLYNYYPPQLTGEIYRRMIPKGEIVFFSGTKNNNTANKFDYSLYQIKGLTKMYIHDCNTYPDCHYSKNDLEKLISPKASNQMAIWSTDIDKSSAIDSEKYVIVAYCEDDGNDNSGYCEFETSIFSGGQDIILVENEKFSKFVLKGEKGKFIADLQSGRQIQRLTIDVMIFSGDVSFNYSDKNNNTQLSDEKIHVTYEKYYLSNKIFFHFNLAQLSTNEIVVDYIASLNSFFTIQYSIHSYNVEQYEEKIPSGESYLVQIDPASKSKTKTIYLLNQFYKNENPFLSNFFELNCEFEVFRGSKAINFFDGYAQEIINKSDIEYRSEYYEYNIRVIEPDPSNYKNKMCMLYVAGYESEIKYDREIIVGENINQQIIFNNDLKKIRFLYPISDIYKDLAVYVNVIDKAIYTIKFYINNQNIEEKNITISQIIYLSESKLMNYTEENLLNQIIVEVEYTNQIIKTDPMLEITIRKIRNSPVYLQKGISKLDFVFGDNFYYFYTDIGKNEKGEITVNFLRDSGYLWAKVVRKDQSVPEIDPNWRGIYRMPSEDFEDSLPYNGFTKKIVVNPEETKECYKGCYLLISVQKSHIGDYVEDPKYYPFFIKTRITPSNRAFIDIPKIVIQVDEFVIGNVDVSNSDEIYEFYQVWLPHDSEFVEFDWQSSVACLYINIGNTRPTKKNAQIKLLPPGKDSNINLTKEIILRVAKDFKIQIPKENSLEDISLVIGISTDKSDSIDTEIYSLRIHQPPMISETSLDIISINTDQKILCNPKEISENEYRCLFLIPYTDEDSKLFTPILAFSRSLNNGALINIYADYIERYIYDQYIEEKLKENIPTIKKNKFNNRKEGGDYIYITNLDEGKYLFINVMTDKPDSIMILSSMSEYNYFEYDQFKYTPNPTSEHLLFILDKMKFKFPENNEIIIDIVTIKGSAELYWNEDQNKVFFLNGMDDRISFSSKANNDYLVINNVNELSSEKDPGFVFYITYHPIKTDCDIFYKEINYGENLKMFYNNINLPIALYSKIGTEYTDINIAITFKDNEIGKYENYVKSPLKIFALIVKEKNIYVAKTDKYISPSYEKPIEGIFDIALNTAQIFLSEEKIEEYNIKPTDIPSLYIRIDGNFNFINEILSINAQTSGVSNGAIPEENVYHYGKIKFNMIDNFYRLRTNKNKNMHLQIAFNADNLNFCVSDNIDHRLNTTLKKVEKARGKIYINLEVKENIEFYYLIIFKNKNTYNEDYLNNYAFKYKNLNNSEIVDYKILNSPEIEISKFQEDKQDVIACTFNKIDIKEGVASITYFLKIIDKNNYVDGEEINTISVTNSPYYYIYEKNPKDKDGKITLTAKGDFSNWLYLNVIAQIQINDNLEYVSYNGKKNESN